MRFGCALGMETHYAEIFSAYEELDVDCVLFSTAGNPETPGVFAVEAAGHAAANSIWISYAGSRPGRTSASRGGQARRDVGLPMRHRDERARRRRPGSGRRRARAWRRTSRALTSG